MEAMQRTDRAHAVLALALSLALSLGLAGCAEDDPEADDPNSTPSSTEPTGDPSDEPTDDPSESSSAPADTVAASVYFVGETPIGPRLYREFRPVEADNPLEEAAALMVAGDALDPDYGTLFPPGEISSITIEGDRLVVEVPHQDWQDRGGMTARSAKLAAQQLVYTLQGVHGERLPVVVTHDEEPTTLFGIDTTNGLTAAKPLSVLAFMNVTTPEEGATVADTFTATGVGSSFEATVIWEVRDGSGTAVVEGFTTAEGWIDKLHPWKAEVDVSGLAPGTYSFVAMTDDPSGGEGAGPTEDSKTIIVE
jgi:Immunoglobulin-like domain of bacterial spore germination/Sporulation and spore germination